MYVIENRGHLFRTTEEAFYSLLFSHCRVITESFLWIYSSGGLIAYADASSDREGSNLVHNEKEKQKTKVVVLGTGWAGTSFLKDLDISSYDVQVVSPRNYFAFTPLLPSVTCGTVEARSIVEPVRNIIKKVTCFQVSLFLVASSLYLTLLMKLPIS